MEPVNPASFYGIYGPKGLPKEVVSKVHGAVKTALEDPSSARSASKRQARIIIGKLP